MKDIHERTLKLRSDAATGTLPHEQFSVFESRPKAPEACRGGLVLVQEIFGVNSHMRAVARHFCELGYAVWVPAYFDRIEPGIELTYEPESFPIGKGLVERLGIETALEDTALAAHALKATLPQGKQKLAVMGYCWGGSIAWLAATRLAKTFDASISYYGRLATSDFAAEQPKIPTILHFGRNDHGIPLDGVEKLAKLHPTIPVYIYEAGHGFNCDMRKDYSPEAAALAEKRTLELLTERVG